MNHCPVHKRPLQWNPVKGSYCWSCENRTRQAACEHVYNDKRHAGLLGYRHYCGSCGDMYVGPVDEYGDPTTQDGNMSRNCVQFAQKAVIERGGKLLLVRKSLDDPHQPGRWEFPGGRLENGESPDEALAREVREEVGLDVRPGRPLVIWSWRLGSAPDAPTVVAVARWCEEVGGEVDMGQNDESDFIEGYAWVAKGEVLDLNLIPNTRGPVATILADI